MVRGKEYLDTVDQAKLAVLGFVHNSSHEIPCLEDKVLFIVALAPIFLGSFAFGGQRHRSLPSCKPLDHSRDHLQQDFQP